MSPPSRSRRSIFPAAGLAVLSWVRRLERESAVGTLADVMGRVDAQHPFEVATGRRFAALLEFVIPNSLTAPVKWSSPGLLSRESQHVTQDRVIGISFRNFVQDKGVHGGINTLTFSTERLGEDGFKGANILNSSGMERTHRSPPHLALRLQQPGEEPRVGRDFDLHYGLVNSGGFPAYRTVVTATPSSPQLQPRGPTVASYQRIVGVVRGNFTFRPRTSGTYELTLSVRRSSANRPQLQVEATVSAAANRAIEVLRWVAAGALVAVGIFVFIGKSGRFHR